MLRVHIEPKSRLGDDHVPALERALREGRAVRRELTVADAAELSGLPLDLAEQALMALAHRHPSRVRVTEAGELLFRFDALAAPRGPSAWERFGRRLRRVLEKPLALVMLLCSPFLLGALTGNLIALGMWGVETDFGLVLAIPAGLIALFSTIGAIMTLLAFILLPISGIMLIVGGIAVASLIFEDSSPEATAVIFALVFGGICIYLGVRTAWWGFSVLHGLVIRDTSWVGRFIARSRVFVFGPPPDKVDALADERRLVALLRRRDGIVCVSDLIGLFGWTPAEADLELARILGDYGGDVHVTEDGALVYVFDALLVSSEASQAPEDEAPQSGRITRPGAVAPRFFGADGWLVFVAAALAALGVILHPELRLFPDGAHYAYLHALDPKQPWYIAQGFGILPWLIVLAVPALRFPGHVARRVRARAERRLLPLLAVAAHHPAAGRVEGVRPKPLARLGGTLLDDGRVAFPELAAVVAAADALRAGRGRRAPGEVVFSSDPSEVVAEAPPHYGDH